MHRIPVLCAFCTLPVAAASVGDVDLSTGQLRLSRTVAVAKGRQLALPLNLTYNSRVTKYDHASWLGLGFDLDVPYLERTVVGPPDDKVSHSIQYTGRPRAEVDGIRLCGHTISTDKYVECLNFVSLVGKELTNHGVIFRNGVYRSDDVAAACQGSWEGCVRYANQQQQDVYQLHNFP